MNPGEQPHCLQILSQVEEMLIARISPILQVTYARGGQLKYSGHTICFPQDISTIATLLPRTIDALDIIIVNKENIDHKQYSFMVSRDRVYVALNYKISNDPYYKDVQVDGSALASLPTQSTDISNLLYSTTLTPLQNQSLTIESEPTTEDPIEEIMHNNSFVPDLPNTCREMEEVRSLLQLGEG